MSLIVGFVVMREAIAAAVRAARAPFLLAMAAGCVAMPVPVPGPTPLPAPGAVPVSAIEQEIHGLVNEHRASRGLAPLLADPRLTALAREHSDLMARGARSFGHDGFEERADAARAAVAATRISENVATNNYPAARVAGRAMSGWLGSAGHRQNIEGQFEISGIGVGRSASGDYYITQVFASRR